ncbi:ergothioneine biosynthesis protein EgtC [Allosaccharopolyspora coralli]|nr:ergothioneine biosynthesis protein EgtC [Allosaccharopolyspora coralli]
MIGVCRHLGYLGPPVALDELLLRPEHALLEQTWAPNDMRGSGTVNVDGFGAGWYASDSTVPERYRRSVPMWTDTNFAELAARTTSGAVVAAVRSATAGMPVTEPACAPFTDGRVLFSHNGSVSGWPDSLAPLAAGLDAVDLMTVDAPVDSAVVWALVQQRLSKGDSPENVLGGLVTEIATLAPDSRLNFLFSDGDTVVATTWTHALSVRRTPGKVTVASEPFGAPDEWEPVPDRHLVVATLDDVRVQAL